MYQYFKIQLFIKFAKIKFIKLKFLSNVFIITLLKIIKVIPSSDVKKM